MAEGRQYATPVLRLAAALLATAALAAAPTAAAVTGPLRTLVIPVTWGPEPLTEAEVQALVDRAAAFLATASYGRMTLAATVMPWQRAFNSAPDCRSGDAVGDAARTAAASAGVAPNGFARRVYLLPFDAASCNAEMPFAYAVRRDVTLVGLFEPMSLVHELGHTLALGHAKARVCSRVCVAEEYGDPWDVMAFGSGDFNPFEKAIAGWLGEPTVVRADGDYVLDQFELPSALPQALVVPTGRGELWIDHREPLGNDASLPPAAFGGIEVRQRLPAILSSGLGLHPTLLLAGPNETFELPGTFSAAVVGRSGTTVQVRFRWLDRTPPASARIGRPARRPDGLRLRWHAAFDADSGVDHYDVFLDGTRVATTANTRETVSIPRIGPHTLRVVAIDRAGNRGLAAARRFVLR
jgi:hypothetical protein